MKTKLILSAFALSILSGCATVPTADKSESNQLKQFDAPSEGKSGVYVYRDNSHLGGALKKDVYINGECIGETAPGVFFYQEVAGDKEHTISTESEFSANDITLYTEEGRNYFVQQYIKMGVFVGGAALEPVDEEKGKAEVAKTDLAVKGICTASAE
ncbi:DUF2846 domain-containing protein [Vibrio sp. D404a]|uniref:DUF2846 domain-containing protein n=2 Tax=Vibrio TaxID=662 RepID=UPI0025522765|nr:MULTISPECIES: DUF2846 domain-containing protein [unclassified Vibrio]MDK9739865.1 DUF2846 domain-containing protein [Vibrio sp. D404a]MDK9799193.1 DUF2846 domain-containing protein [Vibrio sp. D449a]